MRPRTLVLVGALLAVSACKPKVPDEYKDLVPDKGLDKVSPKEKGPLNGPGLTLFYKGVSVADIRKGFEEKVSKGGYDLMMTCENANLVMGGKAPNTVVNVSFLELGDRTMVNFEVAEVMSIGFPEKGSCTWTDAAKKLCKVRERDCLFEK